jgi:hypothetical protein
MPSSFGHARRRSSPSMSPLRADRAASDGTSTKDESADEPGGLSSASAAFAVCRSRSTFPRRRACRMSSAAEAAAPEPPERLMCTTI